jgi:hypothetical protein
LEALSALLSTEQALRLADIYIYPPKLDSGTISIGTTPSQRSPSPAVGDVLQAREL